MTLETDRLVLRPRGPDDAGTLRCLWVERDPRVPALRRLDHDGRFTVADLAERLRVEHLDVRPGLGVMSVRVRVTDEVVGYAGLVDDGGPALVYELLRSAHGRGYATEAGDAVVARAGEAGHGLVRATVRDWNVASRRVLAKLGFAETGGVERDPVHGDSLTLTRDLRSSRVGA